MSFIHHILPLSQHGAKIQSTDMLLFMLQNICKIRQGYLCLMDKILGSKDYLSPNCRFIKPTDT